MTLYQYFVSGGWRLLVLGGVFAAATYLMSYIFNKVLAKISGR
jgi:hypothetical protein